MADKPLVSVIIPTKNSEATIEKCLESIKNQTYPNIEIIVVDNFSRDNTKKIAKDSGATLIEIDARMCARAEARNVGIERAKGKFILSLDSDMELDSNVIDACVNKIGEGNEAIVIPETSVGEGFWARCKALERSCYIGDELIEASRFFKKEVFERLGCYDPQLEFGEDWDLNQRVKKAEYRIGRIIAFIKHHEGKLSLSKTTKKKYHYGKTLEKYVRKHPKEAKQQLRLIRPAFIRNWRLLARDPHHAIGMFLMKTCEFGAARLGSIVSFGG